MDAITSQLFRGANARSFHSFQSDRTDGDPAPLRRRERSPLVEGAQRVRDGGKDTCDEPKKSTNVAEAAAALSYRRSEGTSLFIKTQEGDLVKLKISSRESLSMSATLGQDGEQTVATVGKESASSLSISFDVEGDLNEEELAAIRSVIEQTGQLAQQFFNDDVAGAFAAAERLQIDATQLANVGLRMSLREQMTYSAKNLPRGDTVTPLPAATPVSTQPPAEPTPTPATIAAVAAPTATTPVASTPAPSSTTKPAPATTPTSEATPTPPTQSAPDVIRRFLTQLMDKLSAPGAGGVTSASLDMSLKLRIFQSVVTSAAETKAADTGTGPALSPLVPETLDAMAARQEPPLKAVA